MEIFTKNSAKCTIFQSTICNKFSSLMSHCLVTAWQSKSGSIFIGGADVTVKKIPTTIQIILLKKIQFYSESNLFK
jgi:hypothetical protein